MWTEHICELKFCEGEYSIFLINRGAKLLRGNSQFKARQANEPPIFIPDPGADSLLRHYVHYYPRRRPRLLELELPLMVITVVPSSARRVDAPQHFNIRATECWQILFSRVCC
jgi:hypothetical protein